MQSYLLLAQDHLLIQAYLAEFARIRQISHFDIHEIIQEEEAKLKKAAKKSLGIETVKNLLKNIYLTPSQSPAKLIVIYEAHLLTIEAQNALLKILEEPPVHTFIILISHTKETLLSTILSRCFVIDKNRTVKTLDTLSEADLQILLEPNSNTRFELAEKIGKSKEEALIWLEKAIKTLESKLHSTSNEQRLIIAKTLESLLSLHHVISSTNTSPRLAIENLL